jgi:hypothetical protein
VVSGSSTNIVSGKKTIFKTSENTSDKINQNPNLSKYNKQLIDNLF